MVGTVTAAIVDDHPVILDGVRAWLAADAQHRVELIHAARTIEELEAGPGIRADVLVVDLELKCGMIADQVARLAAAGHRIVVFSGHNTPELISQVIDAGASSYLTKDEGSSHLVEAIVAAANDLPYLTPSHAGEILADTRVNRPKLAPQETAALRLWFQGMSKASVGRRLGIAEDTVKAYINRVRLKYANAGRPAPSKAALLTRALEDGLITLADVRDEYISTAARARTGIVRQEPQNGVPSQD
jgi:two-component system nitrate/nitrite response regulator NarL